MLAINTSILSCRVCTGVFAVEPWLFPWQVVLCRSRDVLTTYMYARIIAMRYAYQAWDLDKGQSQTPRRGQTHPSKTKDVTLFGRFRGARRGELSGVSLACKLISKPADQAAGTLADTGKQKEPAIAFGVKHCLGVINHCFGVKQARRLVHCH
ncbi:uncharacterized protein F5Z01DRAFT_666014 [Emericellopsis atlantica]|uniref:Uncharacterized protein n=1 Tax=Emericellopsis atlantica TaxID=2614577 RepID=A0A9P7ZF05_9HYPO|nr:uncharacterized protein F5Z01DRAFT_666014 [Emericellopsis atlantica]KAG9250442.1 hypothetical protein F5Z01DRAFT_666014 [Emericellopsis atlantica]